MEPQKRLEAELKQLIIEALVLEDIVPGDIESDDPLFGEGLGLDSIDALEIAMALEQRYGILVSEDVEEHRKSFASVRTLAAFVHDSLES